MRCGGNRQRALEILEPGSHKEEKETFILLNGSYRERELEKPSELTRE